MKKMQHKKLLLSKSTLTNLSQIRGGVDPILFGTIGSCVSMPMTCNQTCHALGCNDAMTRVPANCITNSCVKACGQLADTVVEMAP
jgi:hypothetical protein